MGKKGFTRVTEVPSNVVPVPFAPQLQLLAKAAVMVGHGGSNGVKESLYFGVPQLILPIFRDSPGNGARIEYHRVGINVSNPKTITKKQFLACFDALIGDPGYRERAQAIGRRFQELQKAQPSVEFVESLVRVDNKIAS